MCTVNRIQLNTMLWQISPMKVCVKSLIFRYVWWSTIWIGDRNCYLDSVIAIVFHLVICEIYCSIWILSNILCRYHFIPNAVDPFESQSSVDLWCLKTIFSIFESMILFMLTIGVVQFCLYNLQITFLLLFVISSIIQLISLRCFQWDFRFSLDFLLDWLICIFLITELWPIPCISRSFWTDRILSIKVHWSHRSQSLIWPIATQVAQL